jgi:hypothetical protein
VNPTKDDMNPLGDGGRLDFEVLAKRISKALPILIPSLISAVGLIVGAIPAIRGTLADARKASVQVSKAVGQEVKDKAEAGYQDSLKRLALLEARMLICEQGRQVVPVRKGAKGRKQIPAPPPRPVQPRNLDEALAQVRAVPPAAPAAPRLDGGGP